MFLKPFKLKSNVQLKCSHHKKLRKRIMQSFNVTDTQILILFPIKSIINILKIITFNCSSFDVYSVDKRPMFFENENQQIFPTIYSLWLLPELLPYFTTYPAVVPKLSNGADLMLPGVVRMGLGMNCYGRHKEGDLIAINVTNNKAAVAVGKLLRSSDDLLMSGGHGACVKILNIIGDNLWNIEPSVSLQIPIMKAVKEIPESIDFPALQCSPNRKINIKTTKSSNNVKLFEKSPDNFINNEIKESQDEKLDVIDKNPEKMDTLIKAAFLTALKTSGKHLNLPVLTSNFYRLHILASASEQIDMKQTTYKKLSKFLNEMANQNFIMVREETKGIEKIVSINFEHPELVNFIPVVNEKIISDVATAPLFHVAMTEVYKITEETIPFFNKFGFKMNEGVTIMLINKILKEHLRSLQKNVEDEKTIYKLDETLTKICCNTEFGTYYNIYQSLISKMRHTFELREANLAKCNKPPIQMYLATRSKNKKVTIVTNLELYGIILSEFSKLCKQGAAASTSTIKSSNQKQDYLQIQGNQIKYIYKLLIETYQIPSQQIRGIEFAKKEKK